MPLKKSAILLMALSASTIGLLVFSSDNDTINPIAEPVKCKVSGCCSLLSEMKFFAPWDMVSQVMLCAEA